MIYIFANGRNETGPMSTEAIAAMARPHSVPVLVDAAAEILTIPNIHLQRGATLVAYSGGKFIRGPQSAGLLLGRKDLVQAAWVHSAPHHGYARAMKVGREEIVGMLVAVESWVKRDHDAEWRQWVARCEHIAVARLEDRRRHARRAEASRRPQQPQPPPRGPLGPARRSASPATRSHGSWTTTEPRIALGGGGGGGEASEAQEGVGRHRHLDRRGDDGSPATRRSSRIACIRCSSAKHTPAAGRDAGAARSEPLGPLGGGDSVRREPDDAHRASACRMETAWRAPIREIS